MNSLEGYNTNGYEYRASQMDRNNSKRLKWMMKEAKDKVDMKDVEDNKIDANNNNSKPSANKLNNNMFKPKDFNRFNTLKKNFK